MSIYDNDTKISPDLNASASQELQAYRLQKLTEIEAYMLNEIEFRGRLAKKMEQFNTVTGIVNTGLITSMVITGGISITAIASGVGLPVAITLSGTSLILSLATGITQNLLKSLL